MFERSNDRSPCHTCRGTGYAYVNGEQVFPRKTCPVCHGLGFVVRDSNRTMVADDQHIDDGKYGAKIQALQRESRARHPIVVPLIIALLVFISVASLLLAKRGVIVPAPIGIRTATPTSIAADLAIIGGSERAFIAKYGPPEQEDFSTGMLIETFKSPISIAVYPTNRSVFGIVEMPDAAGWTNEGGFAHCSAYLPSDARVGNVHELAPFPTQGQVWYQLGESTQLGNDIPAAEYQQLGVKLTGTFVLETYNNTITSQAETATIKECSIKFGNDIIQPLFSSGAAMLPTANQILMPGPIANFPTPTSVPNDVPTPTPNQITPSPTSTSLPTKLPTFTPAATLAPTNTPLPPTDTPLPTATPTPGM